MEKQVFERLAKRFSEYQVEIRRDKKAPEAIESLITEAGKALSEAISSKAIQFEDAPTWFDYVPRKKVESGGKRMAYDIYWLNLIYWICVNRKEIFPDWHNNNATEFLWTVQFHPDRLVEGSLEESILHTQSVLEASVTARGDPSQQEKIRRSCIVEVYLDLMSLCEDVCSYLADMLTSSEKTDTPQATPETEQKNKEVKEKQEGKLEPKPPEFLQNLLWIIKYGRKHWKIIALAVIILFIFSIFVLPKFDLFSGVSNSSKEMPNVPANYDKTSLHNPPKIIDPNRDSP